MVVGHGLSGPSQGSKSDGTSRETHGKKAVEEPSDLGLSAINSLLSRCKQVEVYTVLFFDSFRSI